MKSTLADVWSPSKGIFIEDIGPNLFRFEFYHPWERDRVIQGGPWTFEQQLLMLKRLEDDQNPMDIHLSHTDFWLQVYDLPVGFMSEKVAVSIGNFVGTFVEADPNNFTGVSRTYLRIRVSINVLAPLKRKMQISVQGGTVFWVNFKYERLPTFCFVCGHIGHADKFCQALLQVADPMKVERAYGAWLRAPTRRSQVPKQSRFLFSRPPQSLTQTNNVVTSSFVSRVGSGEREVSIPKIATVVPPGFKALQSKTTFQDKEYIHQTPEDIGVVISDPKRKRSGSLVEDTQGSSENLMDCEENNTVRLEAAIENIQEASRGSPTRKIA